MERFIVVTILVLSFVALIISALVAYPPELCESEDSTNCIWIGSLQGNGQGASFIDIDGTAYYFGSK